MKYVYIRADHDENGLETKFYDSLDEFVNEMTGWSTFESMKEAIQCDDEELDGNEGQVLRLITKGHSENEWDDEEFYTLEGTMKNGS